MPERYSERFTMKNKFFMLLCGLAMFFICQAFIPSKGIAANLKPAGKSLIIGTKYIPPFAFRDSTGQWQGISIELWRQIASNMNLEYRFEELDLKGMLTGLENASIDAAVAALTITAEREKKFDFSHPFHNSGLGIAVTKEKDSSWIPVINRFFSRAFLKVIFTLSMLLLLVGFLIWFFEKEKNNEQFGGSTLKGIGSGFWWSAVTMTTVGYGDKAPKTFAGRLVGLVWMFVAIIVISSFTAAITSTLTVTQIRSRVRGPQDLNKVNVGSVSHSTSLEWLDENRIVSQSFESASHALEKLAAGELDAVVYDAPVLRYLVLTHYHERIHVLGSNLKKQQYGIGMPSNSILRERINQLVPEIINSDEWRNLLYSYLGNIDYP